MGTTPLVTIDIGSLEIASDRFSKGATPPELPAIYPTKFDLCLDLRTALGITVPQTPLATTDEVIERTLHNASIYAGVVTLWVRSDIFRALAACPLCLR